MRSTARRALALGACALALAGLPGCGSEGSSSETATTGAPDTTTVAGLELVAPTEAARIAEQDGVRVLDVRTAEEYGAGHVAGAEQLDFYAPDFADRLAELDRNTTWVVYCRSGNRSGQATAMMEQLGFASVVDVDGGITAWEAAGLPVQGG